MALLKRGKSKRLVLDVGTSAVRLCELSATKTGFQLTKYFQREFAIDPSMEEDEKLERRQEVVEALLKESKIRTKKTIISVPGQSVFTRNRPLPPVPEYKVTQIVKYEIQQQIPFSLDQISLDYQVLDRTEAGGYDVMMAAIKVDVVEKQLEVLKKARRSIDVVDVSPLAAYNWLRHTGEFGDDGQCVALLDLGATTTDIAIQKDNQFRFTRSLHVGGNDITSAVASSFNMPFLDAEKVKRDKGFAPTGDPKRDGKGGEVIGRVLGRLVNEINRSFAYFRSQPGGGPVARVIVTGGGACLKNIVPYLQRQLGVEVRIAQPLAGVAVDPAASEASEHPEQTCVALGLALRCCEPLPIQINLIPPRLVETARRKEQIFYWFLSIVTMFLILASIIPVTAAKDEQVQQQITQLKNVLASYDAQLINNPDGRSPFEDEFMIAQGDVNGYKRDVEILDKLRSRRRFWLEIIREINDARPRGGGVAISSVQTAVFGGNTNTGDAARQAAAGGQGGGETPAAATPAPVETKPQSAADFLKMAVGAGPGGGGNRNARMFPGINPPRRGADDDPNDSGPNVIEPNALVIYGYANDIDAVQDYVDALKESSAFVNRGIYFFIEDTENVSEHELDSAKTGPVGATGGGGSGKSDVESAMSDLAAGLGAQASATSARLSGENTGAEVTYFHIDVQYLGKPIAQPK